MNKVIQTLREQHQDILARLARGEDLITIIRFVEDIHHKLEEDALFPAVANHPMLREGGPLCTYFWGMEMEFSPKTPAQNLLSQLYKKGFPAPPAYREFAWLNQNTPLSIPMSDHELSAQLTHAICTLSETSESDLAKEFLEPMKNEYIRLLKAHIDKEDNCLFILCERLLSQPLSHVS